MSTKQNLNHFLFLSILLLSFYMILHCNKVPKNNKSITSKINNDDDNNNNTIKKPIYSKAQKLYQNQKSYPEKNKNKKLIKANRTQKNNINDKSTTQKIQKNLNASNKFAQNSSIDNNKNLSGKHSDKNMTLTNSSFLEKSQNLNQEMIDFEIKRINFKHNDNYSKAENIKCTKKNCRFPNVCTDNSKTCLCQYTFAELGLNEFKKKNLSPKKQEKIYCNYERKNQNIYFILEFWTNSGAGHFYAKNVLIGLIKAGFMFSIYLFVMVSLICSFCLKKKGTGTASAWSLGILTFIAFSVWITDAVLIGLNFYTDGNGVPLIPW